MTIATIQTCKTGSDEPNITAKDGVILEGDNATKAVNELYKNIRDISVGNDEKIMPIHNTHLLCVIYHAQKDDKGRIRPALVLWDKNEDLNKVKETLKVMGLDRERFDELYTQYQKATRECESIKKIGGGAIVGACCLGFISLIITKGNAIGAIVSGVIGAVIGVGIAVWKIKK